MANQYSISVLIPTLGRVEEPSHTVKGLLDQTVAPDEIIVVDQNDPPLKELDAFLSEHSQVKHIRNPQPGIIHNYARCLAEATSDIVLFLDDDIELKPTLVESHLRHYPKFDAVAGRVHQPSGDLEPVKISKVGTYNRVLGVFTGNFNFDQPIEVEAGPGGNMSFFREKLNRIGGFDQAFDGNGFFFETDAGMRFTHRNHRMIFDPEAEIVHLMAPRGGARVQSKARHTYFYVKNGILLFRRHAFIVFLPVFLTRVLAYCILKSIYNRDLSIVRQGVAGIWDGLRQPLRELTPL